MQDERSDQVAGASLAAYTLGQLCFLALVENGILLQAEAVERLQAVIDANKASGNAANLVAVALSEPILKDVKGYRKTAQ